MRKQLAGEALRVIYDEAAGVDDPDVRRKVVQWGLASEAAAKRRAALELARSHRHIAARPADFDRDLYLFNCQNGTLDIRTGELRPHRSADLITKIAPVVYDPAARSELWGRVLAEATGDDAELQTVLQRFAGYALTGDCREEVFYLINGPEATMKSTFLGALMATMGGGYAMAADPEVFLARAHVGGPRDDVAGMEGARLVVCAEFDGGRKMAEALLKQLTGGDTVRARHLYQSAREFRFTATLAFHTNVIPSMSADDGAVWRRARVVSFGHTVPEEKRDPTVKARLCDPEVSGAAILAWAVRGCLDWQREGLGKAQAVTKATRAVRLSMDGLAEFIDECCTLEAEAWTASHELHAAYTVWAASQQPKRPSVSDREWGRRLSARGLEARKLYGMRGWRGVRLANEDMDTIEPLAEQESLEGFGF